MSDIRTLPGCVWLVIRPTGERHFVDKPILDGIEAWAKDTDVTIAEYRLVRVVRPQEKEHGK